MSQTVLIPGLCASIAATTLEILFLNVNSKYVDHDEDEDGEPGDADQDEGDDPDDDGEPGDADMEEWRHGRGGF